MEKLIITAAVTGSVPKKKDNPHIPYSPKEIAEEIIRSRSAGAAIAHVHVRDPETGEPSFKLDYYKEVKDRVRSESDILLNFSTSGLNLSGDDVLKRRIAPATLGIDICSLDICTMNLRDRVFLNPPEWALYGAKTAREHGVKPEIECFDTGHITACKKLIGANLLDPPYFIQLCMGINGGIEADMKHFVFMKEMLPDRDVVWTGMGIGRHQFPIAALSTMSGGHVRVGFEDNLYISKGKLARSNAELVEKAVRLAGEFGRSIAQPHEVKVLLKI